MGNKKYRVIAVIPARYASQRLPGKPLLDIAGKSMIMRVYENVKQSQDLQEVIVATDDPRIFDEVAHNGGKVVMTSPDCACGTDRTVEVVKDLPVDFVVNVQGDEPLIKHEMIDLLIEQMVHDVSEPEAATLASPMSNANEFANPNNVKVVMNYAGYALYFSRAPIPHSADFTANNNLIPEPAGASKGIFYKHMEYICSGKSSC